MTRRHGLLRQNTQQVRDGAAGVCLKVWSGTSLSFCLYGFVSGVAANAKVGSELMKVAAIDGDIGNNSVVQYHIVTIRYFQTQSNGSEDVGNIFTIGEKSPFRSRL